eukprot:Nk52_evm1s2078 gene=Nk52_evmTU1s2078
MSSNNFAPVEDIKKMERELDARQEKHAATIAAKESGAGSERSSPKVVEKSKHQHRGSNAALSVSSQPSSRSSSAANVMVVPPAEKPSKAELKRMRREKQERERQAKAERQQGGAGVGGNNSGKEQKGSKPAKPAKEHKTSESKSGKGKTSSQSKPNAQVQKQVELFSHLRAYENPQKISHLWDADGKNRIHRSIIQLGMKYANGLITGSNQRCYYMLRAFRQVVEEYITPTNSVMSRDLEVKIKPYINFLAQCRPLAISMGNAIKEFKLQIAKIPPEMEEKEGKQYLINWIDQFIKSRITLADSMISKFASEKIQDGDVILTYGHSSVVMQTLIYAHNELKRKFRVIIVDGRPHYEGKRAAEALSRAGIPGSYVLISQASYIMKEVTKVVLGAHAFMANGYLMARVGSSLVAMVAKSYGKPVLSFCETYKFCERVSTDSVVFNELGNPDDLVPIHWVEPENGYLSDWQRNENLTLLNIMYDFTPPALIDAVVTEIGIIPCTSVPVVIREYCAHLISVA